jgi:hypothetical protein
LIDPKHAGGTPSYQTSTVIISIGEPISKSAQAKVNRSEGKANSNREQAAILAGKEAGKTQSPSNARRNQGVISIIGKF